MTESMQTEDGSRLDRLVPPLTTGIAVEGLGLLCVFTGLWSVAALLGVGGAVVVAVVLYALGGVYAFAAGQVVLTAATPMRVTPELVVVEVGLVLLLVGRTATRRRLGELVVGSAVLVLVVVGVGSVAGGREADLAVFVLGGFVVGAGLLWMVSHQTTASGAAQSTASTGRTDRDDESATPSEDTRS